MFSENDKMKHIHRRFDSFNDRTSQLFKFFNKIHEKSCCRNKFFKLMMLDDSSYLMTIFDVDDLFFKEFVNDDTIFNEKCILPSESLIHSINNYFNK